MSRLSFGSLYKQREFAPLVLRIVVGLIFMLHGWQKLTGIEGVTQFFGSVGIPAAPVMAWFVAFLETFGGLALILGAFTRLFALLLVVDMITAITTVKMSGMLSDIPKSLTGEKGAEVEILLFSACIALALLGGGKWALDRSIFGQDRE